MEYLHYRSQCMTKIELKADNIVLISIVERNIESMYSAARLLFYWGAPE